MKRIISTMLLLLTFCFYFENAYACTTDKDKGIYCYNGKAYSVVVSGLTYNGVINLPQGEGQNVTYYKEVGNYSMFVNGKLAFCADPNKKFKYGQAYSEVGIVRGGEKGNFIAELYKWAADDPNPKVNKRALYAQVFVWKLSELYFKNASDCEDYQYNCIFALPATYNQDKFIDDVMTSYRAVAAASGGSSRIDFRWILQDEEMCGCIFHMFNNRFCGADRRESGMFNYIGKTDDSADYIEYFYSDDLVYEYNMNAGANSTWKAIATAVWEENSDGTLTKLYDQGTPEAAFYNCNKIARASGDGKVEAYLKITNQGLSDIEGEKGIKSVLASMYNQIITDYFTNADIAYYVPAQSSKTGGTNDSNSDVQPIIAPPASELDPKSCSNYVGSLKALGYSDSQIINEYTGKINFINNEGKVLCAEREIECVTRRKAWILLKRIPNPNYSPKIGNRWIYIYTPDVTESTEDVPKCGCNIEAAKFREENSVAKYGEAYSNCDSFIKNYGEKYAIYDQAKTIMQCRDEDRYASCDPPRGDDYTCSELIDSVECNKKAEGCTQTDLDAFRRKITDGDNASLQRGKIVCAPSCLPSIDPPYCCNKLGTADCPGDSISQLTDAELAPGVPDESCYKKGVSYRVDTNPTNVVSSKDEKLSNSYCDVYCWESVTTYFPLEPQVEHGEMYWWGMNYANSEFAYGDIKRICWTGKIDYDKYVSDWNNNESTILDQAAWYATYKAYIDDSSYETKDDTCSMSCPSGYDSGSTGYDCCMLYRPGTTIESGNCATGYTAYSCTNKGNFKTNYGGKDPSCSGCPSGWSDDKGTCKKSGKKYTRSAGSGDHTATGETKCYTDKPSDTDIDNELDGKHTKDLSDTKSNLSAAFKKRTSIHNNMLACQSITESGSSVGVNDTSAYDYSSYKMTVKAETLPGRGVTDYNLKVSGYGSVNRGKDSQNVPNGQQVSVTCHDVSDDIKNDSNAFASNICYNNGVFQNNVTDNKFNEYNWEYNGRVSFQYTSHFNLVAIIDDPPIVVSEDAQTTTEIYEKNNMTYKRTTMLITKMNATKGYFDVGVEMSGFGNAGHFDKIIEASKDGSSYQYLFPNGDKDKLDEYVCGAYGTNSFYYFDEDEECIDKCDKGIDVVYRIIDMASGNTNKIFPGKDGNSRKIGSNWSSFINEHNKAFKNITSKKYVYDGTPIYSIDLTPTLISEIRRSNKAYRDAKLDPYTSNFDTDNKLKILCSADNDTTKACVSSYITELIKSNKITGKFAEKDEEKRIKLIKDYKSCYDRDNPNC